MVQPKDMFWSFVLSKVPVKEFESWVYKTPELETVLGSDMYLDLLSTHFTEKEGVAALKNALHSWLEEQGYPTCECFTWGARAMVYLGFSWGDEGVEERYRVVRERTPWVALRRCRLCEEYWYMACDTVDDDWHFVRVSEVEVARVLDHNEWPRAFDGEGKYGLSAMQRALNRLFRRSDK